jgi:hypothetical protein
MPGVARRGDVALAQAPAEIPAARAAHGDEVQFLGRALPHVGDPRVAGGAVEAVAQGVAQAVGVDLAACTGGADAGVVGRHRVVDVGVGDVVAIDVHARHLAQQRVQPLAVVERVVAAAAVAGVEGQRLGAAVGPHAAIGIDTAEGRQLRGQRRVRMEDNHVGQHQQQQPQRQGPGLQPADRGDPVRDQRDHDQRADEAGPGRRDVEGQLQRVGHDGRL